MSERPEIQPVAIVIGIDCITGLQIARTLHRHDVRVIGIANNPNHFAVRSRCVSRIEIANWDAESLLECLEGLATSDRPVLMPATDTAVNLVAMLSDRLSTSFRIANAHGASIEKALGKAPFAEHTRKHGISSPQTRVVETSGDLRRAATDLNGPYVLKPNVKTQRWDDLAGVKVLRAEGEAELVRAFERCQDWSDGFVVQEWIDGDDDAMYSYYAFVSEDEQIIAECVGHKIRQWPRLIGSGTLSEIYDDPEIRELGRMLLESLDHRGFATVNMKRDARTGQLFVIETNVGRPGMGMFVAEAAGIDMTYLAYRSLAGMPASPEPRVRFPKARWVSLKRDFAAAFAGWRRGDLSLLDYLRSMRGVRRLAVFDLRDPAPFVYDVLRAPGQMLRRRPVRDEG